MDRRRPAWSGSVWQDCGPIYTRLPSPSLRAKCWVSRTSHRRSSWDPCIFGMALRMIRASVNRGSRLGPKTSVQGKPWDTKILQVFFNIRGENFSFFKKMLNSLSFLLLLCVSGDFKQKKFFLKFFLTNRKISSSNHVVFPILKLFTTYNFWKIRFH